MRRRITVGVIVAILVLGIGAIVRGKTVPVEVVKVSRQTVREFVSEDAKTRLDEDYVIDMPVTGTLERIALKVGDRVEKDSVLARVDPFDLTQQVTAMEAAIAQVRAQVTGVDIAKPKPEDLASAQLHVKGQRDALAIARKGLEVSESDFTNAEREFERRKSLLAQHAVSQSQYDDAERAYRSALGARDQAKLNVRAAEKAVEIAELAAQRLRGSVNDNEYQRDAYQAHIKQLEGDLGVLRSDLRKTEIKAPISGVVLEKDVEDSRVLASGTPLLTIGDLSTIEIESDILSEDVVKIHPGDPVVIEGKVFDGSSAQGKVKQIYPAGFKKISALGIEQQRVKILVSFDNSVLELRPGTRVDIKVVTAEHANAVAVPERATFRREGQWGVFVVRRGRAVYTPVQVGLRNDDWAEIVKGLQEGEAVVAEPTNDLEDGQCVTTQAKAS